MHSRVLGIKSLPFDKFVNSHTGRMIEIAEIHKSNQLFLFLLFSKENMIFLKCFAKLIYSMISRLIT